MSQSFEAAPISVEDIALVGYYHAKGLSKEGSEWLERNVPPLALASARSGSSENSAKRLKRETSFVLLSDWTLAGVPTKLGIKMAFAISRLGPSDVSYTGTNVKSIIDTMTKEVMLTLLTLPSRVNLHTYRQIWNRINSDEPFTLKELSLKKWFTNKTFGYDPGLVNGLKPSRWGLVWDHEILRQCEDHPDYTIHANPQAPLMLLDTVATLSSLEYPALQPEEADPDPDAFGDFVQPETYEG